MRNAGLEEAQVGIKIAGRNSNNLRHTDDTTLMAGSEEELKNFLMIVKEESEKVGLKLNIQKTKIMASGPFSSVQFSHSVVSDSLRPHESQHARPPCPSPTPFQGLSFNVMAAITICSDFGAQKIKSDTVSTVSPSISHEVMGLDAMVLVF